jgi:hypothetical protein
MTSEIYSALTHAGCPATSLRRSCVGMCLPRSRSKCVSTDAPGTDSNAAAMFSAVKFLFRVLLRNGWVECSAAVACADSVWSLTCDRGPSMFVIVRCFPSSLEYKWVFVL